MAGGRVRIRWLAMGIMHILVISRLDWADRERHLLNPHPFGKTSGSDAKLQLARRFRGKSPLESGILRLVWMWGPALPCRNILGQRGAMRRDTLLVLADKVPARARAAAATPAALRRFATVLHLRAYTFSTSSHSACSAGRSRLRTRVGKRFQFMFV